MQPEGYTLTALLSLAGLLIWFWQLANRVRLPPFGFGPLTRRLRMQTIVQSAETIRHDESEVPDWRLSPDWSRLVVWIIRLCLIFLYSLACLWLTRP